MSTETTITHTVRPMSMSQAAFLWNTFRYAKLGVSELSADKIEIKPEDTQAGISEMSGWKGPKWAPGSPDHQRKLAEFEVAGARARILASMGVGHEQISPILDYWTRIAKRGDMSARQKAEGMIERLQAVGITAVFEGTDEPAPRPRQFAGQPVEAQRSFTSPTPIPAKQPADVSAVVRKTLALKAMGLADEQIEQILKIV